MKTLRGTVFGGIAFFLLGWLVYGILLMDFMIDHTNSVANRADEDMVLWAMFVSSLLLGLLLTLFLKRSGAKTWMDGLKTGALFGLILGLSMDLSFYAMTIMYNTLWIAIADALIYTIIIALVGLVIPLTWGKKE